LLSTFIGKLTASNGETNEWFGSLNAVSISNNRIVVGAYGYNNGTGAAYLFGDPNDPQSGRKYSQLAILTASDGEIGDYLGVSVDIDGDTIVVGADDARCTYRRCRLCLSGSRRHYYFSSG
jgi:hypothetical protein